MVFPKSLKYSLSSFSIAQPLRGSTGDLSSSHP